MPPHTSTTFTLIDVYYPSTQHAIHQLDGRLVLVLDNDQCMSIAFGFAARPSHNPDETFFDATLEIKSAPRANSGHSMKDDPLWAPLINRPVTIATSSDNRVINIKSDAYELYCYVYSDEDNQDVMRIAAAMPESLGYL